MVYAIAIESIERRVNTAQLTVALVNALGGEAEPPTLTEAQREFDEWLLSEPEPVHDTVSEWRQVMGVGA